MITAKQTKNVLVSCKRSINKSLNTNRSKENCKSVFYDLLELGECSPEMCNFCVQKIENM